jgi:hypothetical protein
MWAAIGAGRWRQTAGVFTAILDGMDPTVTVRCATPAESTPSLMALLAARAAAALTMTEAEWWESPQYEPFKAALQGLSDTFDAGSSLVVLPNAQVVVLGWFRTRPLVKPKAT